MGRSADLAAAVARAGVDPTLPERLLEDALCVAIADRRGCPGDWWHDPGSLLRVKPLVPDRQIACVDLGQLRPALNGSYPNS
jgi:hypothetical protein